MTFESILPASRHAVQRWSSCYLELLSPGVAPKSGGEVKLT
jgi:hypothetical protein